jgi:hypothetical protein
MARCRFVALLSLTLAVSAAQTGRSEESKPAGDPFAGIRAGIAASDSQQQTCVIYKLDELGNDLDLGKWIAETIPEVIEPRTWTGQGVQGQGVLRYYGPKKILVVYHTPAVQTKVEGFLKSVKKSMPTTRAKTLGARNPSMRDRGIVPAQYHPPASVTTSNPVPEPNSSYPVAAPVRQPKHLFHFIIRYEGDGIIDDNVVKFMKAQYQAEKSKSKNSEVAPTTVPSGYTTAPVSAAPPVGLSPAESSYPAPSLAPSVTVAPSPTKKGPANKKAEKEKKEDKQP